MSSPHILQLYASTKKPMHSNNYFASMHIVAVCPCLPLQNNKSKRFDHNYRIETPTFPSCIFTKVPSSTHHDLQRNTSTVNIVDTKMGLIRFS